MTYGEWVTKRSLLNGELSVAQMQLSQLRQTKTFIDNADRLIEMKEDEVRRIEDEIMRHNAQQPSQETFGREFL